MEEKTYSFYGFLAGSFVLICMSYYYTQDLNYIWLLLGDGLTVLVWEVSNEYSKKEAGQNKEEVVIFEKKRTAWDIAAWFCNFAMMVLTVVTADFVSNSHASAVYAILGLIICFAGSFFCDIDILSFGTKPFRNPVTHSFLVPFVVWWYPYLVLSFVDHENFLIIFPAMFCLGAATHLIMDTLPENAGFIKRFEELFNIKYNSKQIQHIPDKWQHLWLLVSAGLLAICFGFSIPRFYGADNYTWTLPQTDYLGTLATFPYILILIIGLVGIGGFFAALIIGWKYETFFPKKPKTEEKTPAQEGKPEQEKEAKPPADNPKDEGNATGPDKDAGGDELIVEEK